MTMILTCGCEVNDFDHAFNVMYRSYGHEGNKAIANAVYCGACEDRLRQKGILFDTEEAAINWLNEVD